MPEDNILIVKSGQIGHHRAEFITQKGLMFESLDISVVIPPITVGVMRYKAHNFTYDDYYISLQTPKIKKSGSVREFVGFCH